MRNFEKTTKRTKFVDEVMEARKERKMSVKQARRDKRREQECAWGE